MKRRPTSRRRRSSTRSVLRLLDLEHSKTAVLNTLGASSEFDQQSMIALGSSRTLDVAEPVVEGLPTIR